MDDPATWQNFAPGNLKVALPAVTASDVAFSVQQAVEASREWSRTSLAERTSALEKIHSELTIHCEVLARQIALEAGKPLTEARGEMTAVLAKFSHVFADAERYLADETVLGGPHPAMIRRRPRGPAAVIGPFNFPLHLGNGAILAYLLAGNCVLYKPSPFTPLVARHYGDILARHLPPGVFQIVQGHGKISRALALHAAVRSVCFTGSVAVGKQLAIDLAEDYSKDLALELGGKNALFVACDADLTAAAHAAAEGMCLTAGQRCNGTSRVWVDAAVATPFYEQLGVALQKFIPGDPTLESTSLGPVISSAARERHEKLIARFQADTPSSVPSQLNGHYVSPATVLRAAGEDLLEAEQFVPFLEVVVVDSLEKAVEIQNRSAYGLSAAIFTKNEARFRWFADAIVAGNVYANLPTTFSPSTLPFGGLAASGNHHPGGKGFARFAADEQAVQWANWV